MQYFFIKTIGENGKHCQFVVFVDVDSGETPIDAFNKAVNTASEFYDGKLFDIDAMEKL